MRLDKLLANTGHGSRKEVKALIKKKKVTVNGQQIKDSGLQIDPEHDSVYVNDEHVHYRAFIYIMLNKPSGYISATADERSKTVVDLLPDTYKRFNPFPVGRLDKDTEGLLLITNDGELGHHLTSPKKAVEKTYYAEIRGHVTEEDVTRFRRGVELEDGYITKPAYLEVLKADGFSGVNVTVTEGKFHQIKRMFEAVGKKVTFLKRIRMSDLVLDDYLRPGEHRELTEAEVACLRSAVQKKR